jgi:hypothetical protein
MKPLSETLTDLIGFAEEVIGKPAKFRTFLIDSNFSTIASEIRHAEALPAEGIRTTGAGMIMVVALDEFFAGDIREATSPWLGVAGVTLPLLRGDALRARLNEIEARRQS